MRGEIKLKDYFQLGNHASQNTLVVNEDGEESVAISLNEFTEESKTGSGTDKVITGIEEYQSGTLSRETARFFGLTNAEAFSKHASTFNHVLGAEGFLTEIMTSIKETIEKLIRFIMGGVNWLVNGVKSLLGLSANTARREKKAADIVVIRKDMEAYLKHIGFPSDLMDLNKFVDGLPPEFTDAFKNIACDNKNITTYFVTLQDTIEALTDLQRDLTKKNLYVAKEQAGIKEGIAKLYKKLELGNAITTYEFQDLVIKINEAILNLDYRKFQSRVKSILERHYKTTVEDIDKLGNEEYKTGVNAVNKLLTDIQAKLEEANPKDLAYTAVKMMEKIATARANNASRTIPSQALNISFDKGNKEITMLHVIEETVTPNGRDVVRLFAAYIAEIAKYTTLCKEICVLLSKCFNEQKIFYDFYCKLNISTLRFLSEGLDGFAQHANDQKFHTTSKYLFASETTASDVISQFNMAFETIHESGDLMKVKSRIDAFKRQMEF